MDEQGNILVKRVSKSNVYIKSTSDGDENSIGNEILKCPGCALELEKPVKVSSNFSAFIFTRVFPYLRLSNNGTSLLVRSFIRLLLRVGYALCNFTEFRLRWLITDKRNESTSGEEIHRELVEKVGAYRFKCQVLASAAPAQLARLWVIRSDAGGNLQDHAKPGNATIITCTCLVLDIRRITSPIAPFFGSTDELSTDSRFVSSLN